MGRYLPEILGIAVAVVACVVIIFSIGEIRYATLQASYLSDLDTTIDPIPRINTEMHAGSIRFLGTDAAGRFAVTGSNDNTVRVWAIPWKSDDQYRLLNILRPPIGDGNDGYVTAVAISPDGSLIAIGARKRVMIFDRLSGRLVSGHGHGGRHILSLAFSPDGRTLVAGLSSKRPMPGGSPDRGVSIAAWRQEDGLDTNAGWERARFRGGESSRFTGSVFTLDFVSDADGGWRLAIGSSDGLIHLYNERLELIENLVVIIDQNYVIQIMNEDLFNKLPPLERIVLESSTAWVRQLRFDPSGRRLAVGAVPAIGLSIDSIAILDSQSFEPLAYPPTRDIIGDVELSVLEWSQDGASLFAGGDAELGSFPREDDIIVRVYGDDGRVTVADLPVSHNTIVGLRSFEGRRLLVASQDPQLLLLDLSDAKTKRTIAKAGPQKIDTRGSYLLKSRNERTIRVSSDGTTVSAPFYTRRAPTWRFDLASRALETFDGDAIDLAPPEIEDDNVVVKRWAESSFPSVGGEQIPLFRHRGVYQRSLALAHSPTDDSFLLGTNLFVHRFDRDGLTIWRAPAFAEGAWQVNVTPDGRFAVAALGDGTIRWYDMELEEGSGRPTERLALYVVNEPESESPRWIAWTPSGYYDAAPGAENLIGWHVNRGLHKESYFFSASQFRDLFYRPDIISTALEDRVLCVPLLASLGVACEDQPHFAKGRFGVMPPPVVPPPSVLELWAALPPVVRVVKLRTLENGYVAIDYEVENTFDVDIEVEVFVNGSTTKSKSERIADTATWRGRLTLPSASCAPTSIRLVARTVDGRTSDPLEFEVGGTAAGEASVCDDFKLR